MSSTDLDAQGSTYVAASDLSAPEGLSRRSLRTRLLLLTGLILAVVAVVTLLPGLEGLRTRLSHARPGWLVLGVGLKVLSGLGYIAVFRMVFCRRMSWRVSYQIGMSELGANALFPTGGAGGLALGAWALKRGGMPGNEIARRTVAFFLLTSVANVVGVIVVGIGLAVRLFPGEVSLALTAVPAVIAAVALAGALLAGRASPRLHRRLERNERREASRRSRVAIKTLVAIADGVNEAVALLREGNAWLIGGMIAYLLFDVMILWATFRAFGAAPPLAILWIAYLIGELGGLIPGAREASAASTPAWSARWCCTTCRSHPRPPPCSPTGRSRCGSRRYWALPRSSRCAARCGASPPRSRCARPRPRWRSSGSAASASPQPAPTAR